MSKTGPLHGTRSKKINNEVVEQPSPTPPSTKTKRGDEKALFSTMFPEDDEIVADLGTLI
jgi:hypothetical protein